MQRPSTISRFFSVREPVISHWLEQNLWNAKKLPASFSCKA
jgi:hypothetical protein